MDVQWTAVLRRLPEAKVAPFLKEPDRLPALLVLGRWPSETLAFLADEPEIELYSGPLPVRKVENTLVALYFSTGWKSLHPPVTLPVSRVEVAERVLQRATLYPPVEQLRADWAATDGKA